MTNQKNFIDSLLLTILVTISISIFILSITGNLHLKSDAVIYPSLEHHIEHQLDYCTSTNDCFLNRTLNGCHFTQCDENMQLMVSCINDYFYAISRYYCSYYADVEDNTSYYPSNTNISCNFVVTTKQ